MRWLFIFIFLRAYSAVLVVGGAGFIGSHVNELLYRAGYDTVVLDNLSTGDRRAVLHGVFIEGDMADANVLDRIFETYPIEAVLHFAASIEAGESVHDPLKYYINNVSNTLTLLDAMRRHEVKLFIFSSSAAVFGNGENPVSESSPFAPINPYGKTKQMIEMALEDLDPAYGIRYTILRYFNAAGGDPERNIKKYSRADANLIPKILRATEAQPLTVFGADYPTPDGTCIRDFIHIDDLGTAHIAAMERLFRGGASSSYNLGNGKGVSVREAIEAAERVTGRKIPVVYGARRPGDPVIIIADDRKARAELGWEPKHSSIDAMIEDAWHASLFP